MKNIFIIAQNTFREAIRDRILYGIIGFSFLYVALTFILAKISLGDIVVLKSFGLAGIYIFGNIITIFLGASIIYKEIETRTLYFVLSKPISRLDVILGKFFGLFTAVILVVAMMTVVYLCVVFYGGGGFDSLGLLAVFYQILEMGLFVALLIFFSMVSTPLASTIATAMILFTGHSFSSVLRTASQIGGIFYKFILAVYYVFPNLEKFNIRNSAVHNIVPSGVSVLLTIVYAIFYIAVLLFIANAWLKQKEL